MWEEHRLEAYEFLNIDGYQYQFHHWAKLDEFTGYEWEIEDYEIWDIVIPPEFDFHIYKAFYKGGSYWVDLDYFYPDPIYAVGDTVEINWRCHPGLDSTSKVSIYLDRYAGTQNYQEELAFELSYETGNPVFNWIATEPIADSCHIKITAYDKVDNQAEEFAEYMFAIDYCNWLVGDANGNGFWEISDAVYLIAYVFERGPLPTPHPVGSGDADCGYTVDVTDAVYMINYVFDGGPEPGYNCSCSDYY